MSDISHDQDSTFPQGSLETTTDFEPSCSLTFDLVDGIFESVAQHSDIRHCLRLMKSNDSLAHRGIRKVLSRTNYLRIEIRTPKDESESVIVIQGSETTSIDEALLLVKEFLENISCLKRLYIKIEDANDVHIDSLLDPIVQSEKTKLSKLVVHRRVGAGIPKIVDLIKKNTSTLKHIDKIGVGEAAEAFDTQLHLDELSLMTFDLGFDASRNAIDQCFIRIAESKATTKKLEYTSFEGFDPTDYVTQNFLESLEAETLRLTMMHGPFIPVQPSYMIGKVRRVLAVDMVEIIETADRRFSYYNKLKQFEPVLRQVFPHINHIHFHQKLSQPSQII